MKEFEGLSPEQKAHFQKVKAKILGHFDVSEPEMGFDQRLQRRMAFYNRRALYKNTCCLTGKPIIANISPDKPFKVMNTRDWLSDKFDPLEYGRDFDFSRPFFEQFYELMLDTPLNALSTWEGSVNSDFVNDAMNLKNCYMIFDGVEAENCVHGETFLNIKNSIDFSFLFESELTYECLDCHNCYDLKFSQFCQNCSESWFLKDCIGCKNCFGCVNLVRKQYCIFNEQKTKEGYEEFIKDFDSGSRKAVEEMREKSEEFFKNHPVKATRGIKNENVIGDNINSCKNCYYSFDCKDLEDCLYCTDCVESSSDCMDIHVWGGNMQNCYNSAVIGYGMRNIFCSCYIVIDCTDIFYSYWCSRGCQNLFGCVGLKKGKYCIFNKQYSKEEYLELKSRITEHMKKTGEWGLFFPPEFSIYGYNETLAQDYFPMKKDEVESRGWKWSDYVPEVVASKVVEAKDVPDHIDQIPDNAVDFAIRCEITGRLFKVTSAELLFYRRLKVPFPRRHPDQRHWDRLKFKNPYKLWKRKCAVSGEEVFSSYSEDRLEKVYGEKAFRERFY